VTSFMYDDGWKNIAEEDDDETDEAEAGVEESA
jgi:hypothetical protein